MVKNKEEVREYWRKYNQEHKEEIIARRRKWFEKNREKMREYMKEYHKGWYLKNKENKDKQNKEYGQTHRKEAVIRVQRYVAKNKEKVYGYGYKYNKSIAGGFRSSKSSANKKGYDFLISFEEYKEFVLLPCAYCGENEKRIGIDRIDNSKGYTKENSAPCCKTCNYMKKNHSVADFLVHIKKIAMHNKI